MARSRLALLAAVSALAGCGGEAVTAPKPDPPRPAAPKRFCSRSVHAPQYRTCWVPGPKSGPSTIERRESAGGWSVIARPPVRPYRGSWHGRWIAAFLSPDRRTLLAQWSAECEIPIAFFVPARGGRPSTVLGVPYAKAPESLAKGWESDGRARVEFWEGLCGKGVERPGLYLVDPKSRRVTFVRPLKRRS